jgi:plastocyanin
LRYSVVRLATSVLSLALVGAGLGAFLPAISKAQSAPPASPAASPSAAGSAAATAAFSVDTKNFAYVPPSITVPAGSKVVFTNSDTVAHTVTASDGSFDSKNMDPKSTWSHVFAKAGTYAYVCAYHAFMKGTVIVK